MLSGEHSYQPQQQHPKQRRDRPAIGPFGRRRSPGDGHVPTGGAVAGGVLLAALGGLGAAGGAASGAADAALGADPVAAGAGAQAEVPTAQSLASAVADSTDGALKTLKSGYSMTIP